MPRGAPQSWEAFQAKINADINAEVNAEVNAEINAEIVVNAEREDFRHGPSTCHSLIIRWPNFAPNPRPAQRKNREKRARCAKWREKRQPLFNNKAQKHTSVDSTSCSALHCCLQC